jgi:hypothetical protein
MRELVVLGIDHNDQGSDAELKSVISGRRMQHGQAAKTSSRLPEFHEAVASCVAKDCVGFRSCAFDQRTWVGWVAPVRRDLGQI